jgi:DNA-binding transcriptional ArsR family regulator
MMLPRCDKLLESCIFQHLHLSPTPSIINAEGKGGEAIPQRAIIAKELSHLLGALSHPHRIRIVEELRAAELDVNSIQQVLGISHSAVSQNLAVLRAHRLVRERREGRRVFYSLTHPALAAWLLDGITFLSSGVEESEQMRDAAQAVKAMWGPQN